MQQNTRPRSGQTHDQEPEGAGTISPLPTLSGLAQLQLTSKLDKKASMMSFASENWEMLSESGASLISPAKGSEGKEGSMRSWKSAGNGEALCDFGRESASVPQCSDGVSFNHWRRNADLEQSGQYFRYRHISDPQRDQDVPRTSFDIAHVDIYRPSNPGFALSDASVASSRSYLPSVTSFDRRYTPSSL